LAEAAGASIVGIGTLIEKSFEGGRTALEKLGVPVVSLVTIERMDDAGIFFKD
jgi:xanthine phosphoribosyltransferase